MANLVEPRTCRVCGRPLPPQEGPGRIRQYCSAKCRDRARRQRAITTHGAGPVVKDDLTQPGRQEYVDIHDRISGAGDPVTAKVAAAARRLVDELDHPASPDGPVAAARDLSGAADAALQAAVDRARSAGQTWREIGRVLGTSRQAAFQRFGHPVDPRTGMPATRTVPPGAVQRAVEFVATFTAGLWEEVLDDFDDHMRQGHDPARLANGWAHMIGMYGSYQGMGEVSPIPVGDGMVVDVLLRFEAGEAMLWVRFDRHGKVSGLRLHPTSR
jgi:predicted nucleic acid-binding Zn ribbon protein